MPRSIASSSFAPNGRFTRTVQSRGRLIGQGAKVGRFTPALVRRAERLPHFNWRGNRMVSGRCPTKSSERKISATDPGRGKAYRPGVSGPLPRPPIRTHSLAERVSVGSTEAAGKCPGGSTRGCMLATIERRTVTASKMLRCLRTDAPQRGILNGEWIAEAKRLTGSNLVTSTSNEKQLVAQIL